MNHRYQSGFTLLELISVLAIIGILSSLSYPLYTQHIIKTRRSHAQVALLDLAGGMERYYSDHNSYAGATLATTETNEYTASNFYQLAIAEAADDTFLLTATPKNAQEQDKTCGILSVNQLGEKMMSGTGTVRDCW